MIIIEPEPVIIICPEPEPPIAVDPAPNEPVVIIDPVPNEPVITIDASSRVNDNVNNPSDSYSTPVNEELAEYLAE